MILAVAREAHDWWWWTKHFIGIENASGTTYLFWSGFVGDLALFAAVIAFARHKNCHVKGCWHLGHPDPVHGHPTCKTHSPHFDPHGRLRPPVETMSSSEFIKKLFPDSAKPVPSPRDPRKPRKPRKPSAPPADPSNH